MQPTQVVMQPPAQQAQHKYYNNINVSLQCPSCKFRKVRSPESVANDDRERRSHFRHILRHWWWCCGETLQKDRGDKIEEASTVYTNKNLIYRIIFTYIQNKLLCKMLIVQQHFSYNSNSIVSLVVVIERKSRNGIDAFSFPFFLMSSLM